MLFTPYIIDLLDDNTALQVSYGPAVGPKTDIGTTTVAARAHGALKRITSQDFGGSKDEWTVWWNDWWAKNREKFR